MPAPFIAILTNPVVGGFLAQMAASIVGNLQADRNVPQVTQANAPEVRAAVEVELQKEVAPVIAHLTNNEPWYRSRVTWGALISGGASIASAFGFYFAPEDIDVIVGAFAAGGTLIGAAWTLYGRWRARKPLGT